MTSQTRPAPHIAVVGATGVVGREILAALEAAGHPAEKLTALASERSEGKELDYLDETIEVEKATGESFRGMALALFAAPAEVAKALAPAAQAAGAWVVDTSVAFRGSAPLVISGVNEAVLDAPFAGRIVAVPSAATTGLVLALEPLRRAFGLARVEVTALLGASHHGQRGIEVLEQQTAGLLSGREAEVAVFPHRLAFNLIPQVGQLQGEWSEEESGLRDEADRLWRGQPELPALYGTAIQVPIFYGTFLVVTAKLRRPSSAEEVRAALKGGAGLTLLDAPGEKVYPMPMLVTADPTVHVGRVRMLPGEADRTTFVVALDNAGRGAALGAVEVGQRLLARAR